MSAALPQPDALEVAVLGAGLMGHAIAATFLGHGARVSIHDPDDAALATAPARIEALLAGAAAGRGVLTLASGVADAVHGCRLVIEAAPEVLGLKQDLFAQLDALAPGAILATNTSVFRIGDVAARTTRPQRVVGTHWWNPPHLIPLVEVTQGPATADETVATVMDILARVGKAPVHVRRDVPGFIGNRLQHAMWREAIALVDAGVCDARTIDTVVRSSFGLRLAAMGPMENADYVGLDLARAVHAYVFPDLETSPEPSPLLDRLIAAGRLGAKSGGGFLDWEPGQREEAAARLEQHLKTMLERAAGPSS
jgi:3-hydroxybutyryl-CoA dehydrogenase